MRFEVKAVRDSATVVFIECDALDANDAARQATAQGYAVLKVHERPAFASSSPQLRFPLMLFAQELSVLVEAGVPLVEAVDTLAVKERPGAVRSTLAGLSTQLRQGRPLSQALQQHPAAFPSLFVATVRAAERTGGLPRSLARYVGYQARLDAVKKKVVDASIYPALLVSIGAIVSAFLLVYVVPRFSQIYADRGSDLPLFSRWLMEWGSFVDANGPLLLGALGIIAISVVFWLRGARLAARFEQLLWRSRAAAERLRTWQLARFYRTAGMLVEGGITLVTAFEMAAGVLGDRLGASLSEALRAIRQGQPVARTLEANGLATAVAMRMLAVGERSGNMGAMLEKAAEFHEDELARWIEWFTRLFEPLLMAVIGLVIGAIVVLMYMPVFELAGSIR